MTGERSEFVGLDRLKNNIRGYASMRLNEIRDAQERYWWASYIEHRIKEMEGVRTFVQGPPREFRHGLSERDFRDGLKSDIKRVTAHFINERRLWILNDEKSPTPAPKVIKLMTTTTADSYVFMEPSGFLVHTQAAERFIDLIEAAQLPSLSRFFRATTRRDFNELGAQVSLFRAALVSLRQFEGCPVGIHRDDYPDENEVRRAFRLWVEDDSDASAEDESPLSQVGRGRPRKQEAAREAYHRQFPGGHHGYTWGEVTNRLRIEENIDIHEDTLRRALTAREEA